MNRVHALLPSAGRIEAPFSDGAGASVKALIEIGGQTLLERSIHALRESGAVDQIVVIGPPEVLEHPASRLADLALEDGGAGASAPDNIFRGLEQLPPGEEARALVVTTDLPFIGARAVREFVGACPPDKQISISVCEREPFEKRFPDAGGEWVRLRDGQWTIGGLYLLDAAALLQARPHMERLFQTRKSQWQMARLLGPLFIARFATKRLSTAHILERCERVLGCSGAAVACAPELAFDVDTLDEFAFAKRMLEGDSERN
jgi:hypothetical protein